MAPRVTSDEAIAAAHAQLVATFQTGRTKTFEWRKAQLEAMRRLAVERAPEMTAAVVADLGRPKLEAVIGEVSVNVAEIDHILKHLSTWMKRESVGTPLLQQPARSEVIREPKGVVLVISPWNFPLNLSMGGMMAAIAAGNCVLLKPSEVASHSEKVLAELLPQYLDNDAIKVVVGGVEESTALLKLRWDHILYTGNGAVARVVARAAAENLTPCTLELGGKSPTVILPGANIPVAVKRILAGKFMNAGQICIAPDYVLVHKDIEAAVIQEIQKTIKVWYGDDASTSTSFGRIINERHFSRVKSLVDSANGQVVVQAGTPDQTTKFMPPTVVRAPAADSPLMKEEIFGPILPMCAVGSVDEVVQYINAGDKPLALYIFGPEAAADEIIARTSSGGACINDTLFHFANPDLPFGGIGESGMGRYHGKWGFDEFSHIRGLMYRATWVDLPQRYPPYTDANLAIFQRVMVGPLLPDGMKRALTAIGGVAAAGVATLAFRSRL